MVNPRASSLVAVGVAAGLLSCKPDEEGRPSLLQAPRVLALRATPAESKPGTATTLEILRAGPSGVTATDQLELALCLARKRLAEPGIVSEDCLDPDGDDSLLGPIENVAPIRMTIPENACSLFGPKVVTSDANDAVRPIDPDKTDGYYQPIRIVDQSLISIFEARITCGLTRSSQDATIEFNRRYRANVNPSIEGLTIAHHGTQAEALSASLSAAVGRNETVTFTVTWPSCPTDAAHCGDGVCGLDENGANCLTDCCDVTQCDREDTEQAKRVCLDQCVAPMPECHGAEIYVLSDPVTRTLRLERESIRISWFVTAGSLERDQSGRTSDDPQRRAENRWTAPDLPGDYWLFVVIRDDRGGANWIAQPLSVQ